VGPITGTAKREQFPANSERMRSWPGQLDNKRIKISSKGARETLLRKCTLGTEFGRRYKSLGKKVGKSRQPDYWPPGGKTG
jgi:hypothetical protein